jgi:hypothetical protein
MVLFTFGFGVLPVSGCCNKLLTTIDSRSTLSLDSALDGDGWLTQRSDRFTLVTETRYPLCRRLGGSQGRSGLVRKMSPLPGFFFLFSLCILSVILLLIVLALPFVLAVQHTQHNHPCPRRDSNPQSQQASGHRPTP